jgi:hypothetical protein
MRSLALRKALRFVHGTVEILGADTDWLDRDDIPFLCANAGGQPFRVS